MSKSHALLRNLRKVHLYLGVFCAPALIFFAFTGALQSLNLHETTAGSSYKPPAWIAPLAQLHKKQTTEVPVRKQRPPSGDKGQDDKGTTDKGAQAKEEAGGDSLKPSPPMKIAEAPAAPQKRHMPMKIFFVLISVSLMISTLTGIYLSYKYARSPLVITGLLIAGLVAPLLLLPF